MDRDKFMLAVCAKACEHRCADQLERDIAIAWLTGATKLMTGSTLTTLGDFLATSQGAKFRRRANWILRRIARPRRTDIWM
jgi:hypothetical protein